MEKVSVLLVDDNALFTRLLKVFLPDASEDAVIVIGEARHGEEALEKAQALQPQVILLDLEMPIMNGLETIPRLKRAVPNVGIVVLTLLDTTGYRAAALAAGADAFISKAALVTDLLPAIRWVSVRESHAVEVGDA